MSVIRKSVVPRYNATGSQIILIGAFGQQITAEFTYILLTATEASPYMGPEAQVAILGALMDKPLQGTGALITPIRHNFSRRVITDGGTNGKPTLKETGAVAEESGETCKERHVITSLVITEGNKDGSELVKSKREELCEAQVALWDSWAQAKAERMACSFRTSCITRRTSRVACASRGTGEKKC